ncbi:MAG: nucleotide exchange factor GrpE [Bacteroidota bacterium]
MENTTEEEKGANVASEAENQVDSQAEIDANAAVVSKLQDELAESKDKYIRLYAEFENHRRRTAKEKLEMISAANEQLIRALLPVVDDFERAEKSIKDLSEKDASGILLIYQKLKKVLDQYGVKAMEVKGDFNPDLHEAITQVPVQDESQKGKIVDVVEKGYVLSDKVIRFAKVVVGA